MFYLIGLIEFWVILIILRFKYLNKVNSLVGRGETQRDSPAGSHLWDDLVSARASRLNRLPIFVKHRGTENTEKGKENQLNNLLARRRHRLGHRKSQARSQRRNSYAITLSWMTKKIVEKFHLVIIFCLKVMFKQKKSISIEIFLVTYKKIRYQLCWHNRHLKF